MYGLFNFVRWANSFDVKEVEVCNFLLKWARKPMCPFSKRKWYAMHYKLKLSWNRQDFAIEFCLWIFQKIIDFNFYFVLHSSSRKIGHFQKYFFRSLYSSWRRYKLTKKRWVCKLRFSFTGWYYFRQIGLLCLSWSNYLCK